MARTIGIDCSKSNRQVYRQIEKWEEMSTSIEAIQFTGENGKEVIKWMKGTICLECQKGKVLLKSHSSFSPPYENDPPVFYLEVETREGMKLCGKGTWIIRNMRSDHYYDVCEDGVFQSLYKSILLDEETCPCPLNNSPTVGCEKNIEYCKLNPETCIRDETESHCSSSGWREDILGLYRVY